MSWMYLIFAGLLEVVWAVGLKYTLGFTRPIPSAVTVAAVVASLYLLSLAQRGLPFAVAYAVWMGIGAMGLALVGTFWLKAPMSGAQWFFFVLLLVSVAGLKFVTP